MRTRRRSRQPPGPSCRCCRDRAARHRRRGARTKGLPASRYRAPCPCGQTTRSRPSDRDVPPAHVSPRRRHRCNRDARCRSPQARPRHGRRPAGWRRSCDCRATPGRGRVRAGQSSEQPYSAAIMTRSRAACSSAITRSLAVATGQDPYSPRKQPPRKRGVTTLAPTQATQQCAPTPLPAQKGHTAAMHRLPRPAHRPDLPARPAALVRTRPCAAAADAPARPHPRTDRHRPPAACGAIAPRCRSSPRPHHHGRGLHAIDPPHVARHAGAAEMRMVHADGQLQGSRCQRHAVAVARARRARRAGGQFRQRRRGDIRLCGGGRAARDDHGAGLHQPGQDGADARARRQRWS